MKKTIISIILLTSLVITFTSCASNEEKAEKLIQQQLSEVLLDWDSYQPISTTVKEAYHTIYNDSTCWSLAEEINDKFENTKTYLDEADNKKSHMEIWGAPSYYSSFYSDSKYYQYKAEYEQAHTKFIEEVKLTRSVVRKLKTIIENLDTTEVIGWEVNHKFRCKTRGGYSEIAEYRYIIDKNFENILFEEDIYDKSNISIRLSMNLINDDFWTKEDE